MTWRRAVPGVDELLLIDGREDDVERLAEPAEQFVLPLDRQRRGAEDQHAVDGLAELHLLDEQARHDRLARAGVVRQQEAQPRLGQHPQVDGLDLVRQRADARQADGEVAVVRVGEADAGRLDEQAEALGIDGLDRGRGLGLLAEDVAASSRERMASSGVPSDRRTRHSKPSPKGADGLQDHRLGEVPRQVDASADGNGYRPLSGSTHSQANVGE